MNEDAADALLKDLEEPPSYAVIVLVANDLGPLPETIRSRCQLVPFRRLSERAVREAITRRAPELSDEEVTTLARVAAGRLDRAARLLDPAARAAARSAARGGPRRLPRPEFDAGDGAADAARGDRRARGARRRSTRRRRSSARADRPRGGAARQARAARRRAGRAARRARGARVVVPRPRRRRGRRGAGGRPRRPARRAARGRDPRAARSAPSAPARPSGRRGARRRSSSSRAARARGAASSGSAASSPGRRSRASPWGTAGFPPVRLSLETTLSGGRTKGGRAHELSLSSPPSRQRRCLARRRRVRGRPQGSSSRSSGARSSSPRRPGRSERRAARPRSGRACAPGGRAESSAVRTPPASAGSSSAVSAATVFLSSNRTCRISCAVGSHDGRHDAARAPSSRRCRSGTDELASSRRDVGHVERPLQVQAVVAAVGAGTVTLTVGTPDVDAVAPGGLTLPASLVGQTVTSRCRSGRTRQRRRRPGRRRRRRRRPRTTVTEGGDG